ncbi:MAG: ABC transporter permease [Brevefilum sp.]
MAKIWSIIKYEYTRHVFNKRFLFSLLSLPGTMLAMAIAAVAIGLITRNTSPIGFVDHSGFLADAAPLEVNGSLFEPAIEFTAYTNIEQAQADLNAEIIQAYYVIPENFPQNREVELYFLDAPSMGAQNQFRGWVINNLDRFRHLDPQNLERLQEGSLLTMSTLDGSRQMREDQWFMFVVPIIAGITFIIVVLSSGGYLLQAVVEEKENRTMEIVITSVTPGQLMTGKTIGNISVGLTQLVVWLIFAGIGIAIAGNFWPALRDFAIPGEVVAVMILLFLPAFVMIAAIMSTIGAIMTDMREAQQISGMFSILVTIPFYLVTPIMNNPNSTIAIILSYFPPSAPITVLMRMAFTTLPTWQLTLNVLILVVFAVFSVWLAGRAFRMGMLQYGKKIAFKDLFAKQEAA